MPIHPEDFAEIQRLLKAGDVQAASDYAAKAETSVKAEEDAAKGIKPAPPPPREPYLVLLDFMEAVASRNGHHPELDNLVKEMRASIADFHENPLEIAPVGAEDVDLRRS